MRDADPKMDRLPQPPRRLESERQERQFFRNVLVLMSGTALAQIITVAVAPLLTRLYNPVDFGIFGVYASIVGILARFPRCDTTRR